MLETGVASDDTRSVNGLVYNFYESAVIDDAHFMLAI